MLFWHYSVEKVVQTYIKKMIYVPEVRKNTFCAFLNSFRHLPICLFLMVFYVKLRKCCLFIVIYSLIV